MIAVLSAVLPLLTAVAQAPGPAALVRDLQHKDPLVRIRACVAAAKATAHEPALIKALLAAREYPVPPPSAMDSVDFHAVAALQACGQNASPMLIEGLGDRQLRDRAARVLGVIRPVDPATLPALRKCLDENIRDPAAMCVVVGAIGALGADGKNAVPDLIALVTSKERLKATLAGNPVSMLFGNALIAFGQIGPEAEAAIPTLLTLAETATGINAPLVRRLSIKSLGQIGFGPEGAAGAGCAPEILAALRKGCKDADPTVVTEAETASALLDPDCAAPVPARQQGLRHRDARVRLQTCRVLGAMGGKAAAARKELEKMLKDDPDHDVRHEAVAALKRIAP